MLSDGSNNRCASIYLLAPTVFGRHKCTADVELGLMPVVTTMADRGTSVVRFYSARTTFGGPIRPPAVFFTGFKSPVCPWMSREKELFYRSERNASSSKISPANITRERVSKSSFLFVDKTIQSQYWNIFMIIRWFWGMFTATKALEKQTTILVLMPGSDIAC